MRPAGSELGLEGEHDVVEQILAFPPPLLRCKPTRASCQGFAPSFSPWPRHAGQDRGWGKIEAGEKWMRGGVRRNERERKRLVEGAEGLGNKGTRTCGGGDAPKLALVDAELVHLSEGPLALALPAPRHDGRRACPKMEMEELTALKEKV